MRAVLLRKPGGPEALELVDLPSPVSAAGEVLVRAAAIGLGRPDVMMRTGKYKWMPPLPGVIGNELAGIVDGVGGGVDTAWRGRRVLVSARELASRGGCYAEEIAVPAAALIALPDDLDPVAAVTLPNYQLAWALLHDATRGRLPRSVYLNGAAGGVGSAVLQLCRELGIEAVGGASSAAKRAVILQQGAYAAVDTGSAPAQVVQSVLEATNGLGVDLVLDHVCGAHFAMHLEMLAPFGLLVSYNTLGGPAGSDVFSALRASGARALGIGAFNMHAYDGLRDARRALLAQPLQWMAQGRLKPVIASCMPLSDIVQAHVMLDRADFAGKLVMRPDGR